MTRLQMDSSLLQRVCQGNPEAMDFLANHWSPYVHEIDDIMDGDRPGKREQLMTFARACVLFSHPFYLRHLAALLGGHVVVMAPEGWGLMPVAALPPLELVTLGERRAR